MNYVILLIVALVGVAIGMHVERRKVHGLIREQSDRKTENLAKVLAYVQEHGRIQNNDVERLVGVSNATAERYLDELEKEGKLTQHGTIGPEVFYSVK